MKFIGDFHIHSKYSRAVSPQMNLDNLNKWASIKGIKVMGTGDFTHPKWLQEIKNKLRPAEPGLFKLYKGESGTRFILTTEISCIYSKGGKVRKVHIIVFAPSIKVVERINIELSKIGNLKADGRPILGLDAEKLAEIILTIDKNCLIIPAHVWTPWFSIFGSKSGFNSSRECFGKYTKYIYAIETGLCSDPAMNRRLSQLDNITLISNSDAHSLEKIGREANVLDTELSYEGIAGALKGKNKKKFLYTIEFFPEEGKYHNDGHRLCNVNLTPQQSKKYKNICPKCNKPLVIGVLNRIEELADRSEGFVTKNSIPFKSLIPLNEIIGDAVNLSVSSKKVVEYYNKLTQNVGNEFEILTKATQKEIEKFSLKAIADKVIKMRQGEISIKPGYDGVYGEIKIH